MGSHTGEHMADVLYNVLERFDITKHLLCITTDNAENNGTMRKELEKLLNNLVCVQLYNNPYPFSPGLSCATIPNHSDNRPLSEHKESGQSGRGAPKCARQSNPSLLGRVRAPVRLTQNRNDRTVRAGAGRTELASQSEAARATCLFATERPGINRTRLYSEAVQRGCTGE